MIETLLIIEDEKLLGSELSRHYRQLGWEVVLAKSLAEAKTLLLKNGIEPLVILSDMNLPDGNALDFMETIQITHLKRLKKPKCEESLFMMHKNKPSHIFYD